MRARVSERQRARRIVKLASERSESSEARHLLFHDSRGFWEKQALDLLDKSRDKAAELGMSEEQVDDEIALFLQVLVLEGLLRQEGRGSVGGTSFGGESNFRAARFRPGDWVTTRRGAVECGIGQVQDVQLISEDGVRGYVYTLAMESRRCPDVVFFESELSFYSKGALGDAASDRRAEVGRIILEQFGGGRSLFMIGGQAHLLNTDDYGLGGLGIKWPNRQRSKGNYVEILLRPDDTYDMTFYNLTMRAKKPVREYRGIYADQLRPIFEHQTGWYLSLGGLGDSDRERMLRRYGYDYTTGEGQKRLMYESRGLDISRRPKNPPWYRAEEYGHDPILTSDGEPTGKVRMVPTGRIVDLRKARS